MRSPKRIRGEIRALAEKLAELELRDALQPLAEDFRRWESGSIDSFDLKDRIHRFHQGPARKIFPRYDTPDPKPLVAHAIVWGRLDPATMSADVLAEMKHEIGVMRMWAEEEAAGGTDAGGSATL